MKETDIATTNPGSKLPEALLDLSAAEALAHALHNAVAAQQQAQIVQTAIISSVCSKILTGGKGTIDITDIIPVQPVPVKNETEKTDDTPATDKKAGKK